MKTRTLLITLAGAGIALGGDTAPIMDKSPMVAPAPAPSIYHWFAGGTAGYLIDNEEAFFSGHIGADMPYQIGGWDTAAYLEVGYFELSDCIRNPEFDIERGTRDATYEPPGQTNGNGQEFERVCIDMEVIPITLNYKLERDLNDSLNVYWGAGAGVALVDLEVDADGLRDSDDDVVFFAQAFAGVLYEVNPSFELYAGGRIIWFDNPEFEVFGEKGDFDDLEDAGFDISDFDGLVEVGGRINF